MATSSEGTNSHYQEAKRKQVMPSEDITNTLKESYNRRYLKNAEDTSDMKYYVVCGKTGDIKFKTDTVDGYLSVWQATGEQDYYVVIKP